VRQSIASIWVIALVITFMLIFSGFIIITINYNKVFKAKNTVITIIEKNNGMTNKAAISTDRSSIKDGEQVLVGAGAMQTINLYLLGLNYSGTGICPTGQQGETWYGVSDLESGVVPSPGGVNYIQAQGGQKYAYCFAKFKSGDYAYYKVKLFFYMDLPIIGSFIPIDVDGTTANLRNVQDGI